MTRVDIDQIGAVKIGSLEVCMAKIGLLEVGLAEVGGPKLTTGKNTLFEIGGGE